MPGRRALYPRRLSPSHTADTTFFIFLYVANISYPELTFFAALTFPDTRCNRLIRNFATKHHYTSINDMTEIQELTEFLKTLTAETDRKFRELSESQRELSKSQRELSKSQRELSEEQRIRSAETDRKFKEVAEEQRIRSAETDRKFKEVAEEQRIRSAETDRELKELGRYVKELSRNINGIADSNGYTAEQFFTAAIERNLALNGVSFDSSESNKKRYDKKLGKRDQYDMILYSQTAVGIVEIKYRLKSEDVEVLATRKIANFRELYPGEAHKDIYLAAAGLSVDAEAVEVARKLGVYVMTQAGEGIKILNDEARVY